MKEIIKENNTKRKQEEKCYQMKKQNKIIKM